MLKDSMRAHEREIIAKALIASGHNRTHTCRELGISRRTLLNKIRTLKLNTRGHVREAAGVSDQLELLDPVVQDVLLSSRS